MGLEDHFTSGLSIFLISVTIVFETFMNGTGFL